ncbi:MAG TPA: hypothetical protein VEW66_02130 [Thermomicrobiales bacterium]|nr:hypothetical protein [Thermomicrobiales bacterium]
MELHLIDLRASPCAIAGGDTSSSVAGGGTGGTADRDGDLTI